jgi:hypothetical protein
MQSNNDNTNIELYSVRITEDPKNPKPKNDYALFIQQLKDTGYGFWDKDVRNKLKTGNYLGFIVGEPKNAKICIYKVTDEKDETYREDNWSQNTGYTSHSIESIPKFRQVIVFEYQTPIIYDWKQWKIDVGYNPRFYPRATQKIKIPDSMKTLFN